MSRAARVGNRTRPTSRRGRDGIDRSRRMHRGAVTALLLFAACAPRARSAPADALVDIQRVAPTIRLDMRYATPDNFTGTQLYPVARCLLRPAVAARLAEAQAALATRGLGLKVFDCYRPLSVQRRMWALVPDERYVADPAKGSRHNRGAAVDVTLARADGSALAMPTGFDDFSQRAHRDYIDLPPAVIANRALLEDTMRQAGFTGLPTEWWHFDADGWQQYDVLDVPLAPTGAAMPATHGARAVAAHST